MTLAEIELLENQMLLKKASGGGFRKRNSFEVNNLTRSKIEAFAAENKECWLGRVNLYKRTRPDVAIEKYAGQMIQNHEFDFAIPCYDAELEKMILDRDQKPYISTKNEFKLVNAIYDRIDELGGVHLFWA